jgi:hypothetical protein
MKPQTLKNWCKARRGRAAALSIQLGCSREFVRQISVGERSISTHMLKLLPAAIKCCEAIEARTLKASMTRIEGNMPTAVRR